MSLHFCNRRRWLASGGLILSSSWLTKSGCLADSAHLDDASATAGDTASPTYSEPKETEWQFGLELATPVTFTGGVATFVIPMDWPEQTVTIVKRDIDSKVTHLQVRDVDGGARQVVVGISRLTANATVNLSMNLKIEKKNTLPPTLTDSLVIPKRVSRDLRAYLGNSPMIDATHGDIRGLSRELEQNAPATAWETVRQIFDTVRARVRYVEGPIRNASDALEDGKGDCEDMTSLFVALCRNAQIPSRMVWVPGHCYPEFYLETDGGGEESGHWYPCQAAGVDLFGEMQEDRPILQKGDRFRVPGTRQVVRYLAETFRCDRIGNGSPSIRSLQHKVEVG